MFIFSSSLVPFLRTTTRCLLDTGNLFLQHTYLLGSRQQLHREKTHSSKYRQRDTFTPSSSIKQHRIQTQDIRKWAWKCEYDLKLGLLIFPNLIFQHCDSCLGMQKVCTNVTLLLDSSGWLMRLGKYFASRSIYNG